MVKYIVYNKTDKKVEDIFLLEESAYSLRNHLSDLKSGKKIIVIKTNDDELCRKFLKGE
jgi:hypothetical protein